MAIPEKRQAGSAVLWLGVVFVTAAGVLFLPRDKAVRAADSIRRAFSQVRTQRRCANRVGCSSTCVGCGRPPGCM
eukprot:1683941-Pleurochrysis_carterae.AAC.1